eukprot:COSAG05_NODE_2819_length_2606_cov_3.957320_1_plen_818_part_00
MSLWVRMCRDPKSYFLGLPHRETDCTVKFWADEDDEADEPCSEERVHLHFDRILRDWLAKNQPLFWRSNHPLLRGSATQAVGHELAATTLLPGGGAMILSQTEMNPISASFLLACENESQRMSEKFDIKPEDMASVAQNLNHMAVLRCAILRRELLLEEKRFEVDVWIPSTKKEVREIVEEQLYRKIQFIQLEEDGDAKLERLLQGLDKRTYVKREVQARVEGMFPPQKPKYDHMKDVRDKLARQSSRGKLQQYMQKEMHNLVYQKDGIDAANEYMRTHKDISVEEFLQMTEEVRRPIWDEHDAREEEDNRSYYQECKIEYEKYKVNRKIRKAWLETRLLEAVAELDSNVEDAHSIVQDTKLSALLEDKKPAGKTNFVWNEFRKKYCEDTEELEKQLEGIKKSIWTRFRYGMECLPPPKGNPDLVLTQHIDGYDVDTYKLKVADETIDEDEEWCWIKKLPGADDTVTKFKKLQETVKQRKENQKLFHLGNKFVQADYNRRLSQLAKKDQNRFEREYIEAQKNSLPVRQLLLQGEYGGGKCEMCEFVPEDFNTTMKRKWQEYYFYSILLQDKTAEEALRFLEPCLFKGKIPHLSTDRLVQVLGSTDRYKDPSVLDESIRRLCDQEVLLPSSMSEFTELCTQKGLAFICPDCWCQTIQKLGTVVRQGEVQSVIDCCFPTNKRKHASIEDSTGQGAQNEGSKGEKCEQCRTDTPPNQDRKREQREFFFFWRLLNDKSHEVRTQSLEQVRIKNKAQTREGPTRALKGLSAANRRPAECAEIEETIKCAGGTSSWENFKTRAVQTTAGALCADCWFDFCNQK